MLQKHVFEQSAWLSPSSLRTAPLAEVEQNSRTKGMRENYANQKHQAGVGHWDILAGAVVFQGVRVDPLWIPSSASPDDFLSRGLAMAPTVTFTGLDASVMSSFGGVTFQSPRVTNVSPSGFDRG